MAIEWIALTWKYRNEIAIGLIILVLVLSGLYIKHVFNDRARLEQVVVEMQKEIQAIKKQQTLNEDIVNAIQKIKVQSNNYVSLVETSPSPPSNSYGTFIPAGVYTQRVYSSNTTRDTKTNP